MAFPEQDFFQDFLQHFLFLLLTFLSLSYIIVLKKSKKIYKKIWKNPPKKFTKISKKPQKN